MLTFRKVVGQRILGEVLVLIQASSTDPYFEYHGEKIGPFLTK